MRSFGKIALPLLFLLTFLHVHASISLADSTLLDGVELDSGYRNSSYHDEVSGLSSESTGGSTICGNNDGFIIAFTEWDIVWDKSDNWTFKQQGLYNRCLRSSGSGSGTLYGKESLSDESCSSCPRSFSEDGGLRCLDVKSDLIRLVAGFVTERGDTRCSQDQKCIDTFGACGIQVSPDTILGRSYSTQKGDSSYTFRIKCEGEKTASILRIEAKDVMLTSENQISGRDFLMNGSRPSYIREIYSGYWENYRVYYWMGALSWDVPIYKRCGESVTVLPSLTSGYGDVKVDSVKAIFDCPVDVNITPPVVMPKKTGNNVADMAVTLLTPAPAEGVDVKLTIERVKDSGGHIEDEHTGTRPKGEITDNDGNKIDTITFAEGETQKMVKYKADEVSGEEKIIAEIVNREVKCEETVRVRVPGFVSLGGGYYSLKTQPSDNKHTGVYNVSSWVRGLFNRIAAIYNQRFPDDGTLVVTDASLAWGGLYDYMNTWSPPHNTHRIGTDIDVRSWNIPDNNREEFEKIVCINYGFPKLEFPGQSNEHYHLYFFPYNADIVDPCVKEAPEDGGGESGGDGGGGDIPT